MKAAIYQKFGPAKEVLEIVEKETIQPQKNEITVKIKASGINPVDVKRRIGGRGELNSNFVVPHFDGAGVVESIGEEVNNFEVGQRVWIYEAQWQRNHGTAAEYITLPANRVAPLPENTTFSEGACLGIPALTAHRCVYSDGPVEGKTILVTGGAGAVGHYAIQFAKLGGANVISTISSQEKAELAKDAGADQVIDYKSEDVVEKILELTNGELVDRVVEVEFGGNLATSKDIIKTGGSIATYASEAINEPSIPFYPLLYKSLSIQLVLVFLMPEHAKQQAISDITSWLLDGLLKHNIFNSYPLEEIALAHESVENGAPGKILIELT